MQSEVLTVEQVLGHGLTRDVLTRLLESGGWRRISSGLVHVLPAPPSWEGLAWGGTLVGGPSSRLGPEASAHLYGLRLRPPLPIDVLVPYDNPIRVRGPWRFSRELPGDTTGSLSGIATSIDCRVHRARSRRQARPR